MSQDAQIVICGATRCVMNDLGLVFTKRYSTMKSALLLLLSVAIVALPALARLGETAQECETRYGPHTREIPGFGDTKAIRVYVKENTEVTAFFVARGGQAPAVGLIFYRVGTNVTQRQQSRPYSDEEVKTLLATVTGVWADYTNPTLSGPKAINSPLARPLASNLRMQPVTTQLELRHTETSALVKKIGELVYPAFLQKLGSPYLKVTDLGHVGNTHFAFRTDPLSSYVRDAVALVSYDALPALQAWAAEQHRILDAKPPPPARNLSGF
jgi:hypothetical protein